jgi:hypothetical protein
VRMVSRSLSSADVGCWVARVRGGLLLAIAASAIPLAASQAASAVRSNPTRSGTRRGTLDSVSCAFTSACSAVGGSTYAGFAERWNGTSWTFQSIRNPSANSGLDAVSCKFTSACTGVGTYDNASGAAFTLAERWNGRSWAIQPTPSFVGTALSPSLHGVSCVSLTTCMAVGYTYDNNTNFLSPLAERWNGSNWAIVPTPMSSAVTSGVSCTSTTACTAVGSYDNQSGASVGGSFAERWNGTTWTIQSISDPAGMQGALSGVSCSSATVCTAVGYVGPQGTTPYVLAAQRWNGTSWTQQPIPDPGAGQGSLLNDVACTSANACTAVGLYLTSTSGWDALAERWNGTSWAIQSTPNPAGATLNSVSCTSATACTAVGANSAGFPLAERWNGTNWTIQPTA